MKNKVFLFLGLMLVINSKFLFAEKDVAKLPETVVTATRTEVPVSRAPGSLIVVDKPEIEMKNPLTVDEVLNDLPGVMVRRGKGLMDTLSSITLRGIPGSFRTLVMIDGIPLNNPYYGGPKLGGFFPEDIERVEVVKGPFSSLYGGYAMGGVINFITTMPDKREIVLKGGYGSGFSRDDAMDDLRRIYFSYGDKIKDRVSLFVSYGRHDTQGYPTNFVTTTSLPDNIEGAELTKDRYGKPVYLIGDKGDNGWWDDGFNFKTQYKFNDTILRFNFIKTRYEYDYDNPHTYVFDNATNEPVYYKEYKYLSGGGGREQNIYGIFLNTKLNEKIDVRLNVSYMDTQKDWYVTVLYGAKIDGCPEGTDPEKCAYVTNSPQRGLNTDLQFSFPIFKNHILTIGGSYQWESADSKQKYLTDWKEKDSTASLKYQSKGKARSWGFYVQDEFILGPKLVLYPGFRIDFWKTYDGYVNQVGTSGYPKTYSSHSESAFSPKFSVVYKPLEGTTVRSSIGKAFRAPSIYELYKTWTSSWSGKVYAGNPELSPEKVTAFDVGVEQDLWKGAKINVTYFYNKLKDMIYSQSISSTYEQKMNVGEAVVQGVEASLEQRFDFGLKLFANITYNDSEVKKNPAKPETEGKRLTYTPLWMANVGTEFKRDKYSFYIVGRYMDKWYNDDLNRDTTSGVYGSYDEYFVVDGRVNYNITKNAMLSLCVNNVLDRDYFTYYKAPGRSYFAEVTFKF